MKITIEPEEGDQNVAGYPVTLVKVHEFIIVGHAVDPAGQRTEFKHLRRTNDTLSLRGLAWGAIEYLREAATAQIIAAFQKTKDKSDGGDGSK